MHRWLFDRRWVYERGPNTEASHQDCTWQHLKNRTVWRPRQICSMYALEWTYECPLCEWMVTYAAAGGLSYHIWHQLLLAIYIHRNLCIYTYEGVSVWSDPRPTQSNGLADLSLEYTMCGSSMTRGWTLISFDFFGVCRLGRSFGLINLCLPSLALV